MTLQALKLDADLVEKIGMVTGGFIGTGKHPVSTIKKPKDKSEETQGLKDLGFNVRRE